MLKEIDFNAVEKMWKGGEIGRVLYVYTDKTEAYISNNDCWTDIVKHHNNGGKFAIEVTGKKFKVEIVETYRRYVEVEAEDEDTAYNDIDNQIAEGIIDLPCDGDNYKYGRALFVSEIKE